MLQGFCQNMISILTTLPPGFLHIPRKTEPNSPCPSSAPASTSFTFIIVCGFFSSGSGGAGLFLGFLG